MYLILENKSEETIKELHTCINSSNGCVITCSIDL